MPRYHRPDPEALKNAAISKGTLKRAWAFARPYRAGLLLYLGTIILGTIIGVLGAQQAIGTVASVLSDVFTLIITLGVMLRLSWTITLLSLVVVPAIIVLDRRLGRRLAALSRTRMKINASMSTTMTERFNVAGALLVKLFGRPRAEAAEFAERAADVRDSGIKLAMAGRIYYGSLALVGGLGTVAVYWLGGHAPITGAPTIRAPAAPA